EALPRKVGARIDLAARRDVAVPEEIRARNVVTLLERFQECEERLDLRLGEGLLAVVVELDADRRRVHVRDAAPVRLAGVPGARFLFDELVDAAVAPDQIV